MRQLKIKATIFKPWDVEVVVRRYRRKDGTINSILFHKKKRIAQIIYPENGEGHVKCFLKRKHSEKTLDLTFANVDDCVRYTLYRHFLCGRLTETENDRGFIEWEWI